MSPLRFGREVETERNETKRNRPSVTVAAHTLRVGLHAREGMRPRNSAWPSSRFFCSFLLFFFLKFVGLTALAGRFEAASELAGQVGVTVLTLLRVVRTKKNAQCTRSWILPFWALWVDQESRRSTLPSTVKRRRKQPCQFRDDALAPIGGLDHHDPVAETTAYAHFLRSTHTRRAHAPYLRG